MYLKSGVEVCGAMGRGEKEPEWERDSAHLLPGFRDYDKAAAGGSRWAPLHSICTPLRGRSARVNRRV